MTFASFGLSEEISRAVTELGYTEPTSIQSKAIPIVLTGQDLLAGAQTGTGKTAGFVLPLLHRLSARKDGQTRKKKASARALILTPTRELAAQVETSVQDYGRYVKLSSMVIYGGVSFGAQLRRLRRPVDIVVATPGRLLDHVQQGTIDLSNVEAVVLDEADRMLDMGFIHDIKKILALLPDQRQSLMFSATFANDIKALAKGFLHKPAIIEVPRKSAAASTVQQKVFTVDKAKKRDLLTHLINKHRWHQVLVFTRTKHGANKLTEHLVKAGIPSLAIHGNKSQSMRMRALAEFKNGDVQVLVATDIAARGIDIQELPHVVNFELPNVPEDYVHRIGRTGRAGLEGEAVSLVCADERKFLSDIEKLIKQSIPRESLSGFDSGEQASSPQKSGRSNSQRNKKYAPKGGSRSQSNGRGSGNSGNRTAAQSADQKSNQTAKPRKRKRIRKKFANAA